MLTADGAIRAWDGHADASFVAENAVLLSGLHLPVRVAVFTYAPTLAAASKARAGRATRKRPSPDITESKAYTLFHIFPALGPREADVADFGSLPSAAG